MVMAYYMINLVLYFSADVVTITQDFYFDCNEVASSYHDLYQKL